MSLPVPCLPRIDGPVVSGSPLPPAILAPMSSPLRGILATSYSSYLKLIINLNFPLLMYFNTITYFDSSSIYLFPQSDSEEKEV